MSVFGSAKTNFSNSEMSLGSSALMTAASTYTLSDCDYYETSSELLSPRVTVAIENSRISLASSPSSDIPNYNVPATRSSSVLLDKATRESSVSIGANGCVLSAKSDTCLSQQSRAISDFVNEVLIGAHQEPSACVHREFYPTPRADGSLLAASEIEPDHRRHTSSVKAGYYSRECSTHRESSTPDDEEKATEVANTMSQARNMIIQNLAQVTYDKLFSRPGWRRSSNADRSQGEPVDASTQKSRFSRRSSRCNGVESILRIDYELQPLNLRLSRLLAEFRAMDLRGKIGFVDPSFYRLDSESPTLPRVGSFELFTSTANETRKTVESCGQFLRREERVAASRSEEKFNALSSREGNRRDQPRDVEGCQLRLPSHCALHRRPNERNVECRKQSSHQQEESDECPSSAKKTEGAICCGVEDNDFGRMPVCGIDENAASIGSPGKKVEIESSMPSQRYDAAFSSRRLISPTGAFLTRPMEAGDSLSNGNDAARCSTVMIEIRDLTREARCVGRTTGDR